MTETAYSIFRDGRLLRRCPSITVAIQVAEMDARLQSEHGERPVYAVSGIDFRQEGRLVGEQIFWNDVWGEGGDL